MAFFTQHSTSRMSVSSVPSVIFPNSVEGNISGRATGPENPESGLPNTPGTNLSTYTSTFPSPSKDASHPGHSSTLNDASFIMSGTQAGIKKMQLARRFWTKKTLIVAYTIIWIILFTDSLQQGMSGNLTPYVTSAFNGHSLTAATAVMASIIGGLCKLPLAKVLDIWGRPQGFAVSFIILVIGLVMMAACHNVNTYAAAQVFYWVGYNGLTYSLQIFMADTSPLENRALTFAFSTSPYLITAWICGPLSTTIKDGPGFRWGYGIFAIVTPLVCTPLLILFSYQGRKANKALEDARTPEDASTAAAAKATEAKKTAWQTVRHYAIEFDLFGLFLIISGLALFLLPFSIYSYQHQQWRSPMILGFLFAGIGFILAFGVYEKFGAPKTFIPFSLLTDRTVLGSCIASGALFVSFNVWENFYPSFLQVVTGVTMAQSGYIISIFSIGSCFFSFVVGGLVRWTGRFKWIAVYFGVPATIVGVVMLVFFRFATTPVALIIVAQIIIACAGGAMVICDQMALMATVPHEYLAVGLALENMFANIGGGIGSTIASALWTGVFPKALAKYLPDLTKEEIHAIYEDLSVQLSHPKGTPIRDGIEKAYSDAEMYMAIAAASVLIIPMVSVVVWRNVRVKDIQNARKPQNDAGVEKTGIDAQVTVTAAAEVTPKKWWFKCSPRKFFKS
ncbi:siderophore iron transporter [Ophiostoma piceae UAMH 11346]|uniref:Siderophore iron transporter n=1 Tax=Ophiostoma piceae (strain UAMH 11346) TaxID=1262450 RepID=S3BT55_OPHP1|nr:siderophore iron transporter [Ophiostoma piceae UAMH 11346]